MSIREGDEVGFWSNTSGLSLSTVFMISGLSKVRSKQALESALGEFGIPKRLRRVSSILIPWTELTVAVGLLFPRTRWMAARASSVSLSVFTAAIANQLMKGRHPNCACFGERTTGPIGPHSLVRNVALMALSVFVGDSSATLDRDRFGSSGLLAKRYALPIVCVAEAGLLMVLLKRYGDLLAIAGSIDRQELRGLRTGARVDGHIEVQPEYAEPLMLSELVASVNGNSRFLFLSSDCEACADVKKFIFEYELVDELIERGWFFVVPERGSLVSRPSGMHSAIQNRILIDRDGRLGKEMRILFVPSLIVVGSDLRVVEESVSGGEAVMQAIRRQHT